MNTSSQYTHEQHIVSSTYARYGAGHYVTRCGRGWTVDVREMSFPKIYRTRREAEAMAEQAVRAYLERV